MQASVRRLFERYERLVAHALAGGSDMNEMAELYASEFIASSPAGIMTGKNDVRLKEVMAQGYARYRAIGTKEMRIRDLRIAPIDENHCVAHAAWRATYDRGGSPDVTIDFDVHYLVRTQGGVAKVFGWMAGDEQAVLKMHGII